ncbi:MAG: hypothetical protein ACE37K_24160 [Planctomycetota bacterium]
MSGRGSWPPLVAFAALFVLAFWLQRSRSTFLRIERQRELALAIANERDLPLADVFALRDLVGVDAPPVRWREAARRLQQARQGGALAHGLLALTSDEVTVRRFELLRERFAARHPGY